MKKNHTNIKLFICYYVLPNNICMKQQMSFKIKLWYKSDTDIYLEKKTPKH